VRKQVERCKQQFFHRAVNLQNINEVTFFTNKIFIFQKKVVPLTSKIDKI